MSNPFHPVSALERYPIAATDGAAGRLVDLYFDDQSWTVRYLVVRVNWRNVLVSPISVERIDPDAGSIVTTLARRRIEESPGFETAKPVSRQHEVDYAAYFGFPHYWRGPFRWGEAIVPSALRGRTPARSSILDVDEGDSHLRSTRAIHGYDVHGRDGDIGQVSDFIVDERDWALHYLVVDSHRLWAHKYVLLSTDWAGAIRWEGKIVEVDVDRESVRQAPEFDPSRPIDRETEQRIFAHFRRPPYWDRGPQDWRIRSRAA